MSTIVVVKKNGKACIAADSLTSFGDLKLGEAYDTTSDKIQSIGKTRIGIVGSAAHAVVVDSLVQRKGFKYDFSSRMGIFETFRRMHRVLKDNYFLNPKGEEEDPYETTHIDAVLANRHGIFGVYALREVYEYRRFWAVGSGSSYALGAMHALYDQSDDAVQIARAGVAAGAEFDSSSALPMTSVSIDLAEAD